MVFGINDAECVNLHQHQWLQMTRFSGGLMNNFGFVPSCLIIGIDEEPLTTMEPLKGCKGVIYIIKETNGAPKVSSGSQKW